MLDDPNETVLLSNGYKNVEKNVVEIVTPPLFLSYFVWLFGVFIGICHTAAPNSDSASTLSVSLSDM